MQLREKNLGSSQLSELAKRIKSVTDAFGAKLIINDDVRAALSSGAAGVHLGQSDMDPKTARGILGSNAVIGVTAKTVKQALDAEAAGADYLGAGAIFPSGTKPGAERITADTLMNICGAAAIPVVAIGGINAENAAELKGTGIAGIAVVSALFSAKDIQSAAEKLAKVVDTIIMIDELENLNRFKAAVLDYDGTILDSMPMWLNAASNYLRKMGCEPSPDLDALIKGASIDDGIRIMREQGVQGSDEEIAEGFLSSVRREYRENLMPKPGIIEILDDLRSHGIKLCIATASERVMIESANKRLGISGYFDAVFTCQEVGRNKHFPDIYFKAAEFFDVKPEETLVFEDVPHASKAAHDAGFTVIGVYDESSADDRPEIEKYSRVYIDNYSNWKIKAREI